jgi:hypothetical protein
MPFAPGARGRLTEHDLGRFPGSTLFDRLARAVCTVERLPRKELYEAWEVARRVRRVYRGGRVVDVGGGHGLLAHVMLLLDDSSEEAVVVDPVRPSSSVPLHAALAAAWPRLGNRISFLEGPLDQMALSSSDIVVSSHACGALTDRILEAAVAVRARVAVLPCCHDLDTCDAGPLRGWLDAAMAIDAMRALRLQERGYDVRTQAIPNAITPKNRLLLGAPRQPDSRMTRTRSRVGSALL